MKTQKVSARSESIMDDAITVRSLSNGKESLRKSMKDSNQPSLLTNGDTSEDGMEKMVSPIVQARLGSGDVNGVNRFKYHSAPFSADKGRLALPLRSNLVSAPLKTTTPVLEEWVEKKPLDVGVRSGSSGYQSSSRSSSRVLAISDRLYENGNRRPSGGNRGAVGQTHSARLFSKPISNGFCESPPNTGSSLPDIDTKDIRLLMSANSERGSVLKSDDTGSRKGRRSVSPPKRLPVTPSSPKTILINLERKDNGMKEIREKLAWRGDKLRQEIEEKLKHVQLRHERAMRILRDQQKLTNPNALLSIDRPQPIAPRQLPAHPPVGNRGFVRRSRYSKKRSENMEDGAAMPDRQPISETQEPQTDPDPDPSVSSTFDSPLTNATPCSPDSNDQKGSSTDRSVRSIVENNLVDSPLVENDIIKPLVDAIIRESVTALSVFRANETMALGIAEASAVYEDVQQFLYNEVIPSAVRVAAFASSSRK